jgi:3-hydroxyisobutyrate dehydrogenase-like beta-hydroxyacid dehydrogenase
MNDSPIGLIGVGLLGMALAERMLAGRLEVVGYDLAAGQLEKLRAAGGALAPSAAAVASRCDVLVVCLPDSDAVAELLAQIESSLRANALLIDATTGDPERTAALAARLATKQIGFVDATIAGSSEQARSGAAVVICGGEQHDFQRAQAVLASWSEKRFHVGPAGSGARLKLIVNLVLGLHRAVLAEGLSLASACGIPPAAALEVLQATPAYSTVMETKGERMLAREYLPPQARLSQHHKDVRLIRELAARHQAITPLSDLHEDLLQRAIELGYGPADNSAILEVFRASALAAAVGSNSGPNS